MQEHIIRSPETIVKGFISDAYRHMPNIPNNQVFYTDNTASTLAYVEGRVVIEYYLLFPNLKTPMHSHPFENQMIYLSGDLVVYRQDNNDPSSRMGKKFDDVADKDHLSSIMPVGGQHGFNVGPRGAIIYNIQIWPEDVVNPLSATLEYLGKSMGSRHEDLMKSKL